MSRSAAWLLTVSLVQTWPAAMAAPIPIDVRGSQIAGPDQQDIGEADWLI